MATFQTYPRSGRGGDHGWVKNRLGWGMRGNCAAGWPATAGRERCRRKRRRDCVCGEEERGDAGCEVTGQVHEAGACGGFQHRRPGWCPRSCRAGRRGGSPWSSWARWTQWSRWRRGDGRATRSRWTLGTLGTLRTARAHGSTWGHRTDWAAWGHGIARAHGTCWSARTAGSAGRSWVSRPSGTHRTSRCGSGLHELDSW